MTMSPASAVFCLLQHHTAVSVENIYFRLTSQNLISLLPGYVCGSQKTLIPQLIFLS